MGRKRCNAINTRFRWCIGRDHPAKKVEYNDSTKLSMECWLLISLESVYNTGKSISSIHTSSNMTSSLVLRIVCSLLVVVRLITTLCIATIAISVNYLSPGGPFYQINDFYRDSNLDNSKNNGDTTKSINIFVDTLSLLCLITITTKPQCHHWKYCRSTTCNSNLPTGYP